MLYNYLVPLSEDFQIFNLFRYLTFRAGGAILTSLVISFIIGPKMIDWLRCKQGEGQCVTQLHEGDRSRARDDIERYLEPGENYGV